MNKDKNTRAKTSFDNKIYNFTTYKSLQTIVTQHM